MKYFTIKELCNSSTAKKLKINNSPSQEITNNLTRLIEVVLDPIRELYGKPIIVSSGYRCLALNKAVKGAINSFHTKGYAADLQGKSNEETKKIFEIAKRLGIYNELFYESSKNAIWVHIAYDPNSSKKVINNDFKVK